MKVTIKQISHISGYSISTVSKALNDGLDISTKTKLKIRKLAKNYNYVPNSAAIALRNKKSNTIALIIPKITDACYANFTSELQKITFEMGYKLIILQSFESHKRENECLNFINNGSVDGVIIFSHNKLDKNSYNDSIVIPKIGINLEKSTISSFKIDDYINFLQRLFDKINLQNKQKIKPVKIT